jgi:hypothetical protein
VNLSLGWCWLTSSGELQTFHPESRTYWFNHWFTSHGNLDEADTQQALTDFRLLGVVLGLAIYNNVLLDFPLPIALYRKICQHEVGLMDLEQFQPTVGKSLRQLLEYSGPGSVEDTFCQVFAIEEDVAGATYNVELVLGGTEIPVTEENRRDFVDRYVDYILNKSVERQYSAFLEGLMMLCKGPAISLFSPVEMERLVCGNPHLDFAALKSAAKYEAGFNQNTDAVVWLWDIAQNVFDLAEKRMFLKFFTGAGLLLRRTSFHVMPLLSVWMLSSAEFMVSAHGQRRPWIALTVGAWDL